jgi:hypothetical protein
VELCGPGNAAQPKKYWGGEFSVWIVGNVVADPCDRPERLLEPPVGPSVEELVVAISGLSGFTATRPTDITIDGHPGRAFELTAPTDVAGFCVLKTWGSTPGDTKNVNFGEVNLIRIVDVDGVRVMITGGYFPTLTTSAQLASLQDIVHSVRFPES